MHTAPWPLRPFFTTISLPLVYSISTVMGAAYVMSLSRHCCGVMSVATMSSSMLGRPT